jgi:secreted PhoX family phosphatase
MHPFYKNSLFAILFLSLLSKNSVATAQTIKTFSQRVITGTEDAEEAAAGTVAINSTDLELVYDDNLAAGNQTVGLRFANLNIPAQAVITKAYVQFTVDETQNTAGSLTIEGQASDNAPAFSTNAYNLSSRARTTAKTAWAPPAWTVLNEAGAAQATPDLKNIIQELINRPGWQSGAAMVLIFTGTGRRNAHAYEGGASKAPLLVIQYESTGTEPEPTPDPGPAVGSFPVAKNSVWRYHDLGQDLGTDWKNLSYDDKAWKYGPGVLGYGDPVTTTLGYGNATSKYPTYYFRHKFNVTDASLYEALIFKIRRDDGAVVYLNGVEIFRSNVPAGNIGYLSQAAAPVGGTDETTYFTLEVPSSQLLNGHNVLAVSVHQDQVTSSDLSFDLEVQGKLKTVTPTPEPNPTPALGTFPVAKNSIWRFHDLGQDLGNGWVAANYDDASWKSGSGALGYGDPVTTTLGYGPNSSAKYTTYYFRHKFNVSDASLYEGLIFKIRRDDGAVIYLNGVELVRTNMPAGPINYLSKAATAVANADETTYFTFEVLASQLLTGTNVLAVSVHQDQVTSSDLSFDLEVQGKLKSTNNNNIANTEVLALGSNWKYAADGTDLGAAWSGTAFNDGNWAAGNAVLGYGNADEATILPFADAADKPITAYFRKTFTVADTAGFKALELKLIRDDGAVVYLNGTEVLRSNLAASALNYQTPALTYVEGSDENTPVIAYINRKLLKPGANTLAVEVHKFNQTETDLRFDAALRLLIEPKPLSPVVQNFPCYPGVSDAIGCFTSVKPTSQQEILVIPETHTFQQVVKAGVTRYNSGSTALIPAGNDFTAYIGQNGSSKAGYISINHENSPGGVSMVKLHLNEQNMTWQPDLVHQVDFSGIVKTERNCSGGITPWGTVITSEESTVVADVNNDGYQDVGWNVEIDPVTGKILDYNGDGQPDKLWAMGRLIHENVVVSPDRVTVYQGEDGGSSCVYKFVANAPGNLSAGTLYVLKRDAANPATGTWVQVPNITQADRNNTGNLAATVGGTNWNNVEDVEIGPDGKIYFTSKNTGTIWRFKDNGTAVADIEAWVTNRDYTITHKDGAQTERFGIGVDNLVFDGEGNLWALQDGERSHIWVIRRDHTPANPRVELFATSPIGAEPTGLNFTPDFKYGFISLQHPSTANTQTQTDAAGNAVQFNNAITIVFARKENLGAAALSPVFDLGPDQTRCPGESVKLTAAVGPDVVVKWNTGATGPELTVTTTGTYTATAYANNGKVYSDAVQIAFTGIQVELGPTQTICATCSTTLDAGPGYNSYQWSTGATTQTITVNTAGTYSVTVTNQTGCTATDAVEVQVQAAAQPPVFDLGPDKVICPGNSVTLKAYSGTDAEVRWNTGAIGSELTVSTAGTYTATAYHRTNGTQYTDAVEVTVSADQVQLGPNRTICATCRTTLDAGSGFSSYQWNTGATSQTITVSTTGTYSVTVKNQNGCTATDAVDVQVQAAAIPPTFELGADKTICAGQSVKLVAYTGADAEVRWNTGHIGSELIVTSAGTYTATAYSTNGTTYSDNVLVMVSQVQVNLGEDISTCTNCPVTLDAGPGYSSYRWSNGATTQSITVAAAGNYSVTVTNQNNCSATDQIAVKHIKKAPILSVMVSPNPFQVSTQIKIKMEAKANVAVEVIVDGQLTQVLFQGQLKAGETIINYQPTVNSSQGIYVLRVSSGPQVITYKMMKIQ